MNCIIASPQKTTHYNHITKTILPTTQGQINILANHAEAFFLLKDGEVVLTKKSASQKRFLVKGGVCYVKNNQIILLLNNH